MELLLALLSLLIMYWLIRAGVKHGTLDAHAKLEAQRRRSDQSNN